MMPLQVVFERFLPRLLARASQVAGDARICFAATTGPETGEWLVTPSERSSRRLTAADRPTLRVEADAVVLSLLFSGQLEIRRAIADGALRLDGDIEGLQQLGAVLAQSRQPNA